MANKLSNRGRKNNDASVALRQNDIEELLLKGKSTAVIMQAIMSTYGISKHTVERDLTTVYKHLRQYFEKAKDDIIAEHIAKYDKIFEESMSMFDFKSALKAMRQKEELLKFHRNEPLIAVQNNTLNLENVTDGQLMKAIEKLNKITNED